MVLKKIFWGVSRNIKFSYLKIPFHENSQSESEYKNVYKCILYIFWKTNALFLSISFLKSVIYNFSGRQNLMHFFFHAFKENLRRKRELFIFRNFQAAWR